MTKLTIILLILTVAMVVNSKELTVSPLGLTYHGYGTGVEDKMVRRITTEGSMVYNPEVNLVYKNEGLIVNAAVLSDCFGHTAYNLGAGKMYKLTETVEYGYLVSLYYRQHMDVLDDLPITMRQANYDLIPLPWAVLSKKFSISDSFSVSMIISSNFALTHAILGLTYKFGGE